MFGKKLPKIEYIIYVIKYNVNEIFTKSIFDHLIT